MKQVVFTSPNGEKIEVKDIADLKQDLIEDFDSYWMQGSGDGFFDYWNNGKKEATLLIGPNINMGLYLHYIDRVNRLDLLSLNDINDLHDVVETAEEIYASKGLFLEKNTAWEAICVFCNTGKASKEITWVTPDIIPPDGNW